MTFPDQKFDNIQAYTRAYFDQVRRAQDSLGADALNAALEIMGGAYERGATLYVCGNGGSASISNHLVCDHSKCIQTDTPVVPRTVSLASNMEMVTAIANDISYDDVFVYQLKTLAQKGDVLVTVSSSGDSENVVRAAEWAKDNGIDVIAMTGFEGGRTGKLADAHLHVDGDNYGVVEDVHQSLMHIYAQYIRQNLMAPDLIKQRKF